MVGEIVGRGLQAVVHMERLHLARPALRRRHAASAVESAPPL